MNKFAVFSADATRFTVITGKCREDSDLVTRQVINAGLPRTFACYTAGRRRGGLFIKIFFPFTDYSNSLLSHRGQRGSDRADKAAKAINEILDGLHRRPNTFTTLCIANPDKRWALRHDHGTPCLTIDHVLVIITSNYGQTVTNPPLKSDELSTSREPSTTGFGQRQDPLLTRTNDRKRSFSLPATMSKVNVIVGDLDFSPRRSLSIAHENSIIVRLWSYLMDH